MREFCSTRRTLTFSSRLTATIERAMSCTIFGATPREGSSSSSSFGRAISARPITSICCSPPLIVPAAWRNRSFRRGKRASTSSSVRRILGGIGAGEGAHQQIVAHRHERKHAPPLGNHGDAHAHDRLGSQAVDALAVERDAALPDASEAGDRAQDRGLAGAVGADQRDGLPLPQLDRDAFQRIDVIVVELDVAESEQRGHR